MFKFIKDYVHYLLMKRYYTRIRDGKMTKNECRRFAKELLKEFKPTLW